MTTVTNTPVAPSFNLAEELWASMQAGLAPWQKTWKGGEAPGRPENVTTGNEYRSGNSLYLMMMAVKNGWSGKWVSFKESMKLGGDLKGQRGTKIEVPLIKKGIDKATGLEKDILRGFRTCTVFNVDQVTGVDFVGKTPTTFIESVAAADKMLAALQAQGLTYVEPSEDGGCWYLPSEDKIGMPLRAAFKDSYEFYSALIHEMSHATMKEGRVERERISFAYEEMRAEIASTLVCCTLNLPRSQEQVDNHAAFLKAWLEEFVDQKSMLLKAASEAQLIHDYLMDLSTAV